MHGEVGPGAREVVVLEDRDARDRVYSDIFKVPDGERQIGDGVAERARFHGEGHVAHEHVPS